MGTRRARRIGLAAGAALLALVAAVIIRSPLRTFNALVPKDDGGLKVASGIAYADGARHRLDVYVPEGASAASNLPVVVFFYGGSWSSGTRSAYDFAGRALAARGFVTVIPDYRLVPEVRFPAFVEDGAAAVRWVRDDVARYGGDGRRIVLMGHSAGAYIAAMLALDDRWLAGDRAAIRGFVGLAGPYDFAPFAVRSSIAAFGDWPDAADTQPLTFAGPGDPPALLLTGTDDVTVKPRNAIVLADKLAAAGVAARARQFDGIGHVAILLALSRRFRAKAPVLRAATAFAHEVTASR
ncbi:alpha/beta hydrolase [Aurantiacibacter spongiae]|uniref:Alpha/beta hydrolase n=1 Tax=Aurantiacibacter spongiae TaxID=2488860 RepID=A0A3N5DBY8_9SPHN|nr:alpha/beta hydrolase [Aurantiacibacter spongiae]RPF72288.1 alpha/beta hydrolase [Aurantiacibacter spongiae]